MSRRSADEIIQRLENAIILGKSDSSGGLNMPDIRAAAIAYQDAAGANALPADVVRKLRRAELVKYIKSSGILEAVKALAGGKPSASAPAPTPTSAQRRVQSSKPAMPVATGRKRPTGAATSRPGTTFKPGSTGKARTPIAGAGAPGRVLPAVKAVMNSLNSGYEHITVEHGGAGHCGFLSLAAAINQVLSIRGLPTVTYKDLREVAAKHIESDMDAGVVMALYMQEFNVKDTVGMPISTMRAKLAARTRDRRWATEFDLNVICQTYGVGLFLFSSRTGSLYQAAWRYRGYSHYITMFNYDRNHYQTIGFRPAGSTEPYRYVFECSRVPPFLIELILQAGQEEGPLCAAALRSQRQARQKSQQQEVQRRERQVKQKAQRQEAQRKEKQSKQGSA